MTAHFFFFRSRKQIVMGDTKVFSWPLILAHDMNFFNSFVSFIPTSISSRTTNCSFVKLMQRNTFPVITHSVRESWFVRTMNRLLMALQHFKHEIAIFLLQAWILNVFFFYYVHILGKTTPNTLHYRTHCTVSWASEVFSMYWLSVPATTLIQEP